MSGNYTTTSKKLEIRKEMRKALRGKQNCSPTIHELETREKNTKTYQETFSDPVKRLRKQKQQRESERRIKNSKIPISAPPTKSSGGVSYGENLCREVLLKLFPYEEHYYRYKPEFLRNPITKGQQEVDILLVKSKVIVEFQDKGSHEREDAVRRDIQKEEMCKFYGYDLIAVPHDEPFIDVFIKEQWEKILRKRLY